jgi:hypothetical protein
VALPVFLLFSLSKISIFLQTGKNNKKIEIKIIYCS